MTSRSRLLLIALLAGFWAWGALLASIEQQEALARFVREGLRAVPEAPAVLGQYARFLLSGLLQ